LAFDLASVERLLHRIWKQKNVYYRGIFFRTSREIL